MVNLDTINETVIGPGMALLPSRMGSDRARVQLLAIGLQESRFEHRRQIGGPARGFWQFERGGGVQGVLSHPASKALAIEACIARGIDAKARLGKADWLTTTAQAVYGRLEHDDLLACAFARLLLWTDPQPLPALGYSAAAWQYYLRTWRPGKPHRETWDRLYRQALEAVRASA